MKKIIAVGVISGIVLFAFFASTAKQLERRLDKNKKEDNLADRNKTEGYFYHQSEQEM